MHSNDKQQAAGFCSNTEFNLNMLLERAIQTAGVQEKGKDSKEEVRENMKEEWKKLES